MVSQWTPQRPSVRRLNARIARGAGPMSTLLSRSFRRLLGWPRPRRYRLGRTVALLRLLSQYDRANDCR